jgi:Tfp pilus assembly protein PilF
MHAREQEPANRRLTSWKEIACFFARDERTVKRWEKQRGLPIHRMPGGEKGGVFVFTDELSHWLDARGPDVIIAAEGAFTAVSGNRPAATPSPARAKLDVVPSPPHRAAVARIIGGVVLVLFLASLTYKLQTRNGTTSADKLEAGIAESRGHGANPEAEKFYLQGRYYWNKRTPDDLNRAVDYFTQAIVRDPNYAQAYAGLADCYNLLREYTVMPATEAYPRAFAAAKKAVELDDQYSAAHASLAFVLFFGRWDSANAELEFRRALDLDPNNAVAHHWYATYLLTMHRMPESLTEIERAQALDPASTSILADKGDILFQAGQRDEAITLLQQMEMTEPAFRSPHLYLKTFYLTQGDYPRFLAESRTDALLLHDNSALAIAAAAEKGFAAGGAKAMFESMLQIEKKYYAQGLVPPTALAQTCALLGNKGEALHYLKAAYDQHDELLLSVKNYPALNTFLHHDPAYRDLLARLTLPVEN